MNGWDIVIGIYTGVLIGICTDRFEDGYKHCLYLPFLFIEFNTYYD